MRRILSFALAVLMVVSSVVVGAVSVTASSGEATGGSTGTDLSVSVGASGNVGSADDLGAILANGGTGIGAGEVGAVELTYKPAEIPDDALAITSADEFAQMGSTGAYYLANDIEISSSNLIFSGELYGNGKTVTTSVPLFETLEGASVYDLTIAGTIDMAGESEVGALVRNASSVYIYSVTNNANVSAYNRPSGIIGTLKGSANLVNCVNNGTITATGNECSGMVGRLVCNTSTSVTNTALVVFESCTNDGTLNAKGNAAGMLGWAGDLEYTPAGGAKVSYLNKSIIVRNCVNTGDITSGTRGGGMLGTIYAASVVIENSENNGNITSSGHGAGMVGWINNYTTTDEIVIKNCINTGEIVTKADAGGIAGYIQAVKSSVIIDNCINDNKATTTGGNRAGGILAACDAVNITVTNCTNTENGDTSTIHYGGGIVGRGEASELLLIENCINLGDFTAVHTSKDRRAAGIFCYNTGSAGAVVINNCVNKGTITGTLRSAGIANTVQGDSLTITNCTNAGKVESPDGIASGIITYTYANPGLIQNCENSADIKGAGHTGGIAAQIAGGTDGIIISNCRNNNAVYSTEGCAGGILSNANGGLITIEYCENAKTAKVTAGDNTKNDANHAGGIIAAVGNGGTVTVDSCKNEGTVENLNTSCNSQTVGEDNSYVDIFAAGIIARCWDAKMITITNCVNSGTITNAQAETGSTKVTDPDTGEEVTVKLRNTSSVAGIVCGIGGGVKEILIENCTQTGALGSETQAYASGMFDYSNAAKTTVKNCLTEGTVTARDFACGVGTRNGSGTATLTVQNCKNTATVKAKLASGILGKISTGTLIIEDCVNDGVVDASTWAAGGILAEAYSSGGTVTIDNCVNKKSVTTDGGYAGGIVAKSSENNKVHPQNITITNTTNEGDVTGYSITGGILGASWITGTLTFERCVNRGHIQVVNAKNALDSTGSNLDAGGILGNHYKNGSAIVIKNCINDGAIDVNTKGRPGGILGCTQASTIVLENLVNTENGTVTSDANYIGGIAGRLEALYKPADAYDTTIACQVTNVLNQADITRENSYGGGIVGYLCDTDHARFVNVVNEGDIQTGWRAAGLVAAAATEADYANVTTETTVMNTLELINCRNSGNISNVEGASGPVGGLGADIQVYEKLYIENCVNTGKVTSNSNEAGGIIAYYKAWSLNEARTNFTFKGCINLGTITAGGHAGGILGNSNNNGTKGYVENVLYESCVNIADVTGATSGSGSRIGGIAGNVNSFTGNCGKAVFNNCLVIGTIETQYTGTDSSTPVGGLVGYINAGSATPFSATNNAVYADLKSKSVHIGSIVSYGNTGDSESEFKNNIFVGSMTAEADNATILLGHRSSSQYAPSGMYGNNYYYLTGGDALTTYVDGETTKTAVLFAHNKSGITGYTELTDAYFKKMDTQNDNVASALGDAFNYYSGTTALTVNDVTVSGNLPVGAYNALNDYLNNKSNNIGDSITFKANDDDTYTIGGLIEITETVTNAGTENQTVTYTYELAEAGVDVVGYSDAYTDEEDYVAPGASGAGLVSGVNIGASETDTGVKDYSEPVKIGSAEEFLAMLPGGNYILTADITLPSSYTLPFAGILDGDGHSVTVKDAPVFAKLSAGTVKDLTVKGEITDTASAYVGALAPVANFSCLVNVTNEANVTAAGMAGGLIGTVHNGISVIDCTNSGNVTSSAKMAGGLVGYGGTYTTVYYESCVNTGDVTANLLAGGITANIVGTANLVDCANEGDVTSNTSYAGGIVAFVGNYVSEDGAFLLSPRSDALPIGSSDKLNEDEDAYIQRSYLYAGDPLEQHVFENCTNSGDISGVLYSAGILAQTFDSVTFRSCSNSGDVSGDMTQELMAGGIASCIAYEGTFYFCENSGTITGNSRVGGIVASIGDFSGSILHGPEGAVKFIACVHSGKVVTNGAFATSATRTAAGIAGYVRVDYGYQSIIFRYCGVTGTVEATLDKTAAGKTVGGTVAGVFSGYVNNSGVTFENNYFTGNITVDGIGDAVLLSYNKSNKISADRIVNNYTVDVPGMYYLLDTAGYHKVPEEFIIGLENDGTVDYEALCETMNSGIVLDPAGNTAEVFLYENEKIVVDLDATSKAPASSAPVSVRNEEEFLSMDPNGNYYLINDITISRSYEYVFRGSFDGKGFKVTTSAPLFKNVENASISNLKIDGEVSYNSRATGAVVCEANGVVLTNITNNADVTNANNGSGDYTGGLIGTVSGAVRIDNCRNNGMISGVNPGGMVGATMNYVEFTAVNSVNTGTITNYSLTASNAGGFIAKAFNGNYAFADCTNTGLVTFNSANSGSTAGGFIGAVDTSAAKTLNMRNCVNGANVIGNGWVGGLLGYAKATLSLDNCVNTGKIISKSNYAGGLVSRADYGVEDSSVKHIFTSCVNTGDVYAHRQYAAGIIALSYNSVTATYCLNTGKMSIDEQRQATCSEHGCHTGTSNAYLQAAGIAASVAGTGIFEYCVNTGELSGTARAAGIVSAMGSGAPGAQTSAHQITGCVNTGRVYNSAKYNAGSTDTGASGMNCYAWGSITISYCTVGGEIINEGTSNRTSPLCLYSNNGGTKFHNNVIVTDTIEGPNRQLLNWYNKNNAPTKSNVNNYIMKDVVDYEYRDQKSVTYVEMSDSYKYYFTAEELWSGDLADKLDDNFAKDTLYPMHNEVVAVYERADVDPDSYIPDGTLPEVRDEETSNEGDESTTEPDDSENTTESDGGENTTEPDGETTTEPDGGENTTEPDDETTTEPDGGESTTEPEVSDPVGTDKPDDGGSGCGSVVSATVALAALALIAPAAICLKKRDEE